MAPKKISDLPSKGVTSAKAESVKGGAKATKKSTGGSLSNSRKKAARKRGF